MLADPREVGNAMGLPEASLMALSRRKMSAIGGLRQSATVPDVQPGQRFRSMRFALHNAVRRDERVNARPAQAIQARRAPFAHRDDQGRPGVVLPDVAGM